MCSCSATVADILYLSANLVHGVHDSYTFRRGEDSAGCGATPDQTFHFGSLELHSSAVHGLLKRLQCLSVDPVTREACCLAPFGDHRAAGGPLRSDRPVHRAKTTSRWVLTSRTRSMSGFSTHWSSSPSMRAITPRTSPRPRIQRCKLRRANRVEVPQARLRLSLPVVTLQRPLQRHTSGTKGRRREHRLTARHVAT